MSKYDPLGRYLIEQGKETIELSYKEIEEIIGDKLPITASNNKAWWSNNDRSHVQSASWSDVSYEVKTISLGKSVIFIRNDD